MKVAWLSDTFEQNNGIATYLQEILPVLSKKTDVTLYTGRVSKQYSFPTVSLKHEKYPLMDSYDVIFPPSEKINCDIVHAHTPYSLGLYATTYPKKITTGHFLPYHFLEWAFGSNQPKLLEESVWRYQIWLLNKFDRVVCQTRAGSELFKRKGLKTKTEIIANGINLDGYGGTSASSFRKKYGIKKEFALFVGRLDASKQPHWIIEIAKKFKNRLFVISGNGTLEKQLKKSAPKNVLFLPRLPRKDLLDCYKAATMLLMPSLVETEGLVAQEALAVGTPLLISDLDILQEVVGNAGFPCRNSSEMGEKAELLFDSKKLQEEMRRKALIQIKTRDIHVSVKKLTKLYESLV